MEGGEVSGNTANDFNASNTTRGGGILNAATLNMNGGKVSGNTANEGGGIWNTFTLNMP